MSDADFIREVEELYQRIAKANTNDFVELAKIAGLDLKTVLTNVDEVNLKGPNQREFASVQPLLENTFEFLRDRGFSPNREEWKKFYTDKGVTLDHLNESKLKLLIKLKQSGANEKTELLQQIFCCDPFDEEIAKTLRDNWHERADLEPNPYQCWFYDLSTHLLGLSSKPKIPILQPISSPNVLASPAPLSSSKVQYSDFRLISVFIGGSIVGLFIMVVILVLNQKLPQSVDLPQGANLPSPEPSFDIITIIGNPPIPASISSQEARNLIQRWLVAKRTMFAPPYDRNLAGQLLTGEAYESIFSEINWLEKNNDYYTFKRQKIDKITMFESEENQAIIEAIITEESFLNSNNGSIGKIPYKKRTYSARFELQRNNNKLKISDFLPIS